MLPFVAERRPDEPDNVVQRFLSIEPALYASKSYIERMGRPETDADLARHHFVLHDDTTLGAPAFRWVRANLPEDVARFRATDTMSLVLGVTEGAGLGFLSKNEARHYPDLVQVMPPRPEWFAQTWLVTHVDLHRTAKVQAILNMLKASVDELK